MLSTNKYVWILIFFTFWGSPSNYSEEDFDLFKGKWNCPIWLIEYLQLSVKPLWVLDKNVGKMALAKHSRELLVISKITLKGLKPLRWKMQLLCQTFYFKSTDLWVARFNDTL